MTSRLAQKARKINIASAQMGKNEVLSHHHQLPRARGQHEQESSLITKLLLQETFIPHHSLDRLGRVALHEVWAMDQTLLEVCLRGHAAQKACLRLL